MKKFLTFLALACLMVTGAWAQWTPPFEAASSYAGITHWYALNVHSNQTHYLYTDGGAIKHNDVNYETSDNYAWGFVGNDTDGYTIYNKATGDAVALDSSTPCALTAAGLSVKWTVNQSSETSEKGRNGFCIIVSGQSYVNYQGGNLARWNSTDAGSTFTPYELDFNTKTYTIHITGAPAGTKVTYNSNQYADGDTFSATGVSSSEITPDPVTGYIFNISISGTDIHVEYSLPPLTGMTDIVEGRVYTLESVDRGYFVYSSTYADGYISGSTRAGYNFNAADENFHFVFLQNGGKTYLYSLGADKFVAYASDGLVTSEKAPSAGIALLASTGPSKATHPTVLRIDDSHQCNMSKDQGKGILTNWNSTGDNGNMLRILPVDELTAEELAAIKEVFNQKQDFTVTITGAPDGTKVTYKEAKYGDGEVISAVSVTKEEITPENVEGYKAEVTVNGTNITVAYYELIKTNQLYVLSTKNRGAWVVDGEDFKSTAHSSVGKDIDPTDKYQQFAIYEYNDAYYLWNEGAQHFINNAGKVVGILEASPVEWSEEAGGTYFFHFTDAAEKYININGAKAMDICYWSYADEGNMMHLTPVEGFDADAVAAVITADLNALKTYAFVLTDSEGNTYEGTFTSSKENPRPACVEGLAVSNEGWEDVSSISDDVDYVYTATITFPFPVNKPTMIYDTFAQNYRNFQLKSTGTGITIQKNVTGTDESFRFTIVPALNGDVFTYTIEDASGNKVYTEATERSHNEGTVTLGETGTPFVWASGAFKLIDQNLYLSVNSSNVDEATVQHLGVWDSAHNGTKMAFEVYEPVTSLDITIGETGYATFYDNVTRTIPEGVNAYYCALNEETGNLDAFKINLDYIPRDCGVVLELQEGYNPDTYTFEKSDVVIDWLNPNNDEEIEIGMTDELWGYAEDTSRETAMQEMGMYGFDLIYVLSKVNGQLGFYKYEGETLGAHKAFYATYSEISDEINGFSLDFGGQTVGVNTVISATNLKAGFDIQGRKLNKMQKGINILNGKKIIK